MAPRSTLGTLARILAAMLVACSTALTAAAPASPAPKTMRVACAHTGAHKLQYLPPGTIACEGRVIRFPKDGPVTACQLDKSRDHTLFVVSRPGRCTAPEYPDSHPRRLPPTKHDLKLCAGNRHGTVRVVDGFWRCGDAEFAVVLRRFDNHPPRAADRAVTIDEGIAKAIALSASDPDGGVLRYSIESGPSHGTLTGSGATRTYHPNAGYTGADSFVFRATDPYGAHDAGTVSIAVEPDAAPVVTTTSDSTAYTENAPAVQVDPGLTVGDSDDVSLDSAAVVITENFQKGPDALYFAPQNGIMGSYQAGTGELTLWGTASVADYQAALRSVTFSTSADNGWSSKTIQFTVSDGVKLSNAATKTIAITQTP